MKIIIFICLLLVSITLMGNEPSITMNEIASNCDEQMWNIDCDKDNILKTIKSYKDKHSGFFNFIINFSKFTIIDKFKELIPLTEKPPLIPIGPQGDDREYKVDKKVMNAVKYILEVCVGFALTDPDIHQVCSENFETIDNNTANFVGNNEEHENMSTTFYYFMGLVKDHPPKEEPSKIDQTMRRVKDFIYTDNQNQQSETQSGQISSDK